MPRDRTLDGGENGLDSRKNWKPKLERPRIRDQQHVVPLQADGWRVLAAWECELRNPEVILAQSCESLTGNPGKLLTIVKGGDKVSHCGGGIVYHRHDEKELNWEPGGVRSGAGVRRSGLSQESSGSSETW